MDNSKLRFELAEWAPYRDSDKKIGETTARFSMYVDDICLTKCEDGVSGTVHDHVFVSLYPLAMWFAFCWWRLHYEILPDRVDHDWRMSHEISSANEGFVWPTVRFAPDQDEVHIWARASQSPQQISLRYLNGLEQPHAVPRQQFAKAVSDLIERVILRLENIGLHNTDLVQLWEIVQSDQKDPQTHQKRLIEAKLGFDPEECPEDMIRQAIALEKMLGVNSFSEIAGAYAGENGGRTDSISALADSRGVKGDPDNIPDLKLKTDAHAPWQSAVAAAKELRKKIGRPKGKLADAQLYDLLGLSASAIEKWQPVGRAKASLAGRTNGRVMKFIPRRSYPTSRRFELARFVGDYLRMREDMALLKKTDTQPWLVTADVSTVRQKFQRAFAAEFLCPIEDLKEFLGDDFSISAVEDAADEFQISEVAVNSLLMNNGFVHNDYFSGSVSETAWPY